jgi:hypothetical protein
VEHMDQVIVTREQHVEMRQPIRAVVIGQ